ncbi:MAG TPA: GNAT family N-acetyltransferase [Sedimentisphaerales bacterium]|nr:GNAT family N-acetyltransferase [Sedimentisphaerales bacterium]
MTESNPKYGPTATHDWRPGYETAVLSASEAIERIRPGQRVFIGTGCGQPQALVEALLDRAAELEGTEIVHLLTLAEPAYRHRELAKHFHINSFFIADNVDDTRQCLGDYTPIFLSDIPRLFNSGRLPIDVALIQVTEPNEYGMCSLGVSVDITKSAAENAALVIAQMNPNMPWTMGDSMLAAHDIDIIVLAKTPILEAELPPPTDVSRQIAEYIAALIPNGSTVELGIREVPIAVLEFLKNKRDLGIHTEVLSDAVVDVVESGAITGLRKNIDRGKIVAGMCMGTRRLYDYVNCNPAFSFRPAEYVSDPHLISQQHNMVAISVGLEVDLTGQVSARSAEGGFTGMGSHMDFTHGASRAPGGKSIVAIEATRDNGAASRIVPQLSRGAGVAATCNEVQYVVTEFGVAYLHGKSLQERAMALISIAHPDFRAELLSSAIEDNYVSSDLASIEGKIFVGPQELRTSYVVEEGTQINFRPMHPTDEKPMRELFSSLSKQTIYYRFMSNIARIPQKQVQDFVYIDYRSDMAIVGTIPEAHGEEIIAIGRYYLNPRTNLAEVAFIVRDDWQRRGIGTFLLKYLISVAKRNGLAGFTAEVLSDNKAMLAVFAKSGCEIRSHLEDRVISFELDFA